MKHLLTALALAVLLVAPNAMARSYVIAVNQFVEHPALDAVFNGLSTYFKENNIEVTFKHHNAQANMGTANQIGQQMMAEQADLLVAIATPSAQACAQALLKAPPSAKRPLLFSAVTDPVAAGLVKDLKNPGGKITGVSDQLPIAKHIEMVRTFLPKMQRLGILYNAGEANSRATVVAIRELSATQGFEVVEATAAKTGDVYQAAASLVGKADAIFIPTDNTIIAALENVLKIGIQHKLPVFAADVDSVRRGAVAAMGFDYFLHGRQTGAMARRILEGADPGTVPVECQKDLQLQINSKYAALMGITPPQALLDTATKIYQ